MAKSSVFKTCKPEELEFLTRQGWTIKEAVTRETVVEAHDGVAAWDKGSEPGSGNYSYPGWKNTTVAKSHVVKEVFYLLEQKEDSIVAELEAKVASLHGKIADADHEKRDLKEKAERFQVVMTERDSEIKRLGGYIQRLEASERSLREAKDRMERDIAKIQRAVGEIRYQEIVGGPIPTPAR